MNLHDDGQPNVPDLQAEIVRLQREVADLRIKHEVACQTISVMQREREDRRSYQVLSALSSWLGQGLAGGTASADEYEARIRAGVDTLVKVETERREQAERAFAAERGKRCGTCRWWRGAEPELGDCVNPKSPCHWRDEERGWPADHGCPQWRRKDGAQ